MLVVQMLCKQPVIDAAYCRRRRKKGNAIVELVRSHDVRRERHASKAGAFNGELKMSDRVQAVHIVTVTYSVRHKLPTTSLEACAVKPRCSCC